MESQSLSNQELRRFKRQISIPGVGTIGQEKLKNSKVIVIGVGGIGSASLQYLTAAGVGELRHPTFNRNARMLGVALCTVGKKGSVRCVVCGPPVLELHATRPAQIYCSSQVGHSGRVLSAPGPYITAGLNIA